MTAGTDASTASLFRGLLAVDLGLRTGVAYFDCTGQLRWYQSRSLHKRSALRATAISWLTTEGSPVSHLALEGGGALAEVWQHEARKRGIDCQLFQADTWRPHALLHRNQRSAADAKKAAITRAQQLIAESPAQAPRTPLRHDVAEAILAGDWIMRERKLAETADV